MNTTVGSRTLLVFAAVCPLLGGCGAEGPGLAGEPIQQSASTSKLEPSGEPVRRTKRSSASKPTDQPYRAAGSVTLTESREAVVVQPHAVIDCGGGFLVADEGEDQVRRYDQKGRLEWHFGRKGHGPTDLLEPRAVIRLPDSTIFVASAASFDSRWTPSGDSVIETYATADFLPPRVPSSLALLGDSLLAIGNRSRLAEDTTLAEPLVSLVDVATGTVVRKIFSPAVDRFVRYAVGTGGYAAITSRGDTLAAVFSLTDTVHLLDASGRTLERIAIPFTRYRPSKLLPEDWWQAALDQVLDETVILSLHWLHDGSFLVFFRDRRNGAGAVTPLLLRMSRSGRLLFESESTWLRAVDTERLRIYVQDPNSLEPNKWDILDLTSLK